MRTHDSEPLALVVEDEPDIQELYELSLQRLGVKVTTAANLQDALACLKGAQRFCLCITDLRLPDGCGLEVVRAIQECQLDVPVAVVTAYGEVQTAVDALKAGAFDFVTKPLEPARLRQLVQHAMRLAPQTGQPALPAVDAMDTGGQALIGSSPPMQMLRALVAKVARTQAPVFIHGESGTGKELIARLIHSQGPRAHAPFVPVNCGAIPSELIESELFGHRKGSFTGATADKPGLFRAAHGGTLFLDEVAELPLSVQVKLLRVLQERAVRPVGAVEEEPVDVRVLSASHNDLGQLVHSGRFRHDLFYRLNVIQIDVPPLRQRVHDIPALAAHILQRLAQREGRQVQVLAASALRALQQYDFAGNVRELENLLERAVALSEAAELQEADLCLSARVGAQPMPKPAESLPAASLTDQNLLQVLETYRWNRTKAAEALGLTLRQLRYRLSKTGLNGGHEGVKD